MGFERPDRNSAVRCRCTSGYGLLLNRCPGILLDEIVPAICEALILQQSLPNSLEPDRDRIVVEPSGFLLRGQTRPRFRNGTAYRNKRFLAVQNRRIPVTAKSQPSYLAGDE